MRRVVRVILKALGCLAALALAFLLVAGSVYAYRGYRMYREAVSEKPMEELVAEIRSMDNFVTFDELPEIYIDAVVSAEDKRFFSHGGVDFLAICRAVWNDLRTLSFAEGGSTITQQLMKNEYFTQEKTFERKFAEIFAAWELEKICTKEEIFELYVNTIYFGSGYYGIYDAALGYYGKTPSELSRREAVMLAGLPNAPSVYSLNSNPDLADRRLQQVLGRMVECGVITGAEAEEIYAE